MNITDHGEENTTGQTETNVPGRNNMVTAAMVIMDELSLLVSSAIAFEVRAMSMLMRLSP
jgi:hypothetical protein